VTPKGVTSTSEAMPDGPVADNASAERRRRTEILTAAEAVIASSGLRTSMREIADASGILKGSLYHHFDSKDAILVELVRRFHDDLDRVAETAHIRLEAPDTSVTDQVVDIGTAIARCAVTNRVALQMSFYEAPSSDPELVALVQRPPTSVQQAMLQILRAGKWGGYIRGDVDLVALADRFCYTLLLVGLDVLRGRSQPDQMAAVLCRMMLTGLATQRYPDAALDQSPALLAALDVIAHWSDEDAAADDKMAQIRAVARTEFGRKGYEFTTVRDIAAAAGLATGTAHRLIGSKEALLASIMRTFTDRIDRAWLTVDRSGGTVIEKLDALSWINISALQHYGDEFKIQLAWLRHSPPNGTSPGSFSKRLRQLTSTVSEGIRSHEISVDTPSAQILARCVMGAFWLPESIGPDGDTRTALVNTRDTLLRGVARRT
jgi:AcrR family transcriptional regulator